MKIFVDLFRRKTGVCGNMYEISQGIRIRKKWGGGGGDFHVKSPTPKHMNIFLSNCGKVIKNFFVKFMHIPIGQKFFFSAES